MATRLDDLDEVYGLGKGTGNGGNGDDFDVYGRPLDTSEVA
jgi:hypothetical protein